MDSKDLWTFPALAAKGQHITHVQIVTRRALWKGRLGEIDRAMWSANIVRMKVTTSVNAVAQTEKSRKSVTTATAMGRRNAPIVAALGKKRVLKMNMEIQNLAAIVSVAASLAKNVAEMEAI
jgi:hypothetical protein